MEKIIAGFVGKFYPPHIGHLWVIDNMVNNVDELYIIISKNETRNKQISDNSNFETISAGLIKKWFQEHYKHNSKIKVEIFDEKNLKPYPEDRHIWADKFKKQFPTINAKIADESYREYNNKFFPNYKFIPINRDVINIHSSYLRQDIKKYFNYLIPEAKEYFLKKDYNK